VVVDGLRVNLAEWGAGAPVVLLHGLGGSSAYMRPLAERLARTRRVVAVDLPGHGGSDPLEPFSLAGAARVLARAAALAGAERPAVLGHSFGAPLAVEWAAAGPVAGLVLCSPVGMVPLELRLARFVLPVHRALAATEPIWERVAATRPLPRRLVFGWFVGMAAVDGVPPALARAMLRDAARAAATVPAALPALAAVDLAAVAARVRAPAIVIRGGVDRSAAASGPPLAAALGAPELVLPQVGHMPMLEAPYAFGAAVSEFLSATVPA
jgi:pimeloyl-ACP methyl ester carboxylesterase